MQMKRFHIKLFFIWVALFISCSSNAPKSVAEKFLTAFSQKKFDEAKKYCTPETVKLVEIAESLAKVSSAKTDFTGKEYEVLSQDVKGATATVKFKEKGSEEVQAITLKYSGNQWLVSIAKEDIMSKQNAEINSDSAGDTTKTN